MRSLLPRRNLMPAHSVPSAVATDPTGHITARAAIKARTKAYKASNPSRTHHNTLPPGAPRKRAPKVYRVPTEVAPEDIAGRLRQMGLKAAVGVNYLCEHVAMTGPGTAYGVALPMRVAASRTIRQLRVAIASSALEGEPVSIWMDPDNCRLLLYWPLPGEELPQYRSVFGLQALAKRGDTLEIPYSAFPENVDTAAYRQQAVHMDHVLARRHSSVWIDAIADDVQKVVKVTRTTDPCEYVDGPSLHPTPVARGPVLYPNLPIRHRPGTHGQTVVTATVPPHLTDIVGAGALVMQVREEFVGIAEKHLNHLAGRLAACSLPRLVSRTPVVLCDSELPY